MQAHLLLRQTSQQLGFTQADAAKRCGVSFSAYEKWERGASLTPLVITGLLPMLDAPPEMAREAALSLVIAEHECQARQGSGN